MLLPTNAKHSITSVAADFALRKDMVSKMKGPAGGRGAYLKANSESDNSIARLILACSRA
eukprot:scaffold33340_cov66-Cyclotella_meneghiniana.AAC.9